MSQMKSIKLKCSKCGEEFDFPIYETINVTENPELKKNIISKEIFKAYCPKCGEIHRINYPVIYADEQKKILVNLVTKESKLDDLKDLVNIKKTNYLSDYRCRLVVDMHEMIEKILVLDSGLNDKAVEVVKVVVLSSGDFDRKNLRNCYFGGVYDNKLRIDVVLRDGTLRIATVTMDSYEKCYEANKEEFEKNPQEWCFVNFDWALNYMAKTLHIDAKK